MCVFIILKLSCDVYFIIIAMFFEIARVGWFPANKLYNYEILLLYYTIYAEATEWLFFYVTFASSKNVNTVYVFKMCIFTSYFEVFCYNFEADSFPRIMMRKKLILGEF